MQVRSARYADFEETKVIVNPDSGSGTICATPHSYLPLKEFLDSGGKIAPKGSVQEKLSYYKRRKICKIENYGKTLLNKAESETSRNLRIAKVLHGGSINHFEFNPRDEPLFRYERDVYQSINDFIGHINAMNDIKIVQAFDPSKQIWPKL